MICYNCRENPLVGEPKRHTQCINDWGIDPKNSKALAKRDKPIKACACQHKQSWPIVRKGS
jgi:hypothetical protein